jgi:hypothetical protein
MKDCVDYTVSKHYDAWLRKAIAITNDKNKGADLLHTVLVRLLDRDRIDARAKFCHDKVDEYVTRALYLSYHSNTSDYAVVYRKYEQLIGSDNVDGQHIDEPFIGSFIDGEFLYSVIARFNEHDAILLRLYSKPDFSYERLSNDTGIPIKYLHSAIHRALNKIRKNVQLQRTTAHPKPTNANV